MRRFVVLLALAACGAKGSSEHSIKVAAASDLERAFRELGKSFQAKTGIEPVFQFGSSGLLAKQVEEGAPFDVFAAANASYVDEAVGKGACDGGTKAIYARGRIVVWSPGEVPATLEDLADPRWKTIAIANPDHAPYGKAAQAALEKAGIWDTVKGRIVNGENVQQAMTYAQSGNADVAIIAASLALASDGGSSLPVDPSLYPPLDQALVVCGTGAGVEPAKKFAAYVTSPEGREIMNRYGFQQPSG
jgi:molybdate transport system substrate-binding protein